MIQLLPYKTSHQKALFAYTLSAEQMKFTALPEQTLQRIKERADGMKHPITILYQQFPIGFFVLDESHDKLEYTDNPNALLFRSLSLNPNYQGKGLGKQAILSVDTYARIHFPNANEIVLGVNFKNKNTYQLYLKCGYVDEGKTNEGFQGKQHILRKVI